VSVLTPVNRASSPERNGLADSRMGASMHPGIDSRVKQIFSEIASDTVQQTRIGKKCERNVRDLIG
jgi:hypothetical protein